MRRIQIQISRPLCAFCGRRLNILVFFACHPTIFCWITFDGFLFASRATHEEQPKTDDENRFQCFIFGAEVLPVNLSTIGIFFGTKYAWQQQTLELNSAVSSDVEGFVFRTDIPKEKMKSASIFVSKSSITANISFENGTHITQTDRQTDRHGGRSTYFQNTNFSLRKPHNALKYRCKNKSNFNRNQIIKLWHEQRPSTRTQCMWWSWRSCWRSGWGCRGEEIWMGFRCHCSVDRIIRCLACSGCSHRMTEKLSLRQWKCETMWKIYANSSCDWDGSIRWRKME